VTTIADVRTQMATAAVVADGLQRCHPYLLDKIVPPCAEITTLPRDPRMVLSKAKAPYRFVITVYVDRTSERAGQELLDTFAEPTGATSLTEAIEAEANWGTVDVDYVTVTDISGISEVELAGSKYLIERFIVEVCW